MNQLVPASPDVEGPAQELVACTPQQVFTEIGEPSSSGLQRSSWCRQNFLTEDIYFYNEGPDENVISSAVQERLHSIDDHGLAWSTVDRSC
ncbi:hypothetical protein GN958_ATG09556 [Phytophthora infestans]|uniref:Uncharacterized protein n=1 Tax=Phytophthora infestans TaxID=4787 RepID=A0A8S9UJX0_PHYIN|nr:hypothetical protein GN958_ATG09556 [Phytophthora infestans]